MRRENQLTVKQRRYGYIKFKEGRPNRDTIISVDEIDSLWIDLNGLTLEQFNLKYDIYIS